MSRKILLTRSVILCLVLVLAVSTLVACSSQTATPSSPAAPAPAPTTLKSTPSTTSVSIATPSPTVKPIVLTGVTLSSVPSRLVDYGWNWFVERIRTRSGGRLTVEYKGGAEAIPTAEQFNAMTNGIVDVIVTAATYHVSLIPENRIIDLSKQKSDGRMTDEITTFLNERYSKLNAYFLIPVRQYEPCNAVINVKVGSPKEMVKLRLAATGAHLDFVKALGATAVSMSSEEDYPALERGVVDGSAKSLSAVASYSMYEVVKYVVLPAYRYSSNTSMYMNLKKFNSLPKDLQDVVLEVVASIAKDGVARDKAAADKVMQTLKDKGMQIIEFTGADAEWYSSLFNEAAWAGVKKGVTPELFQQIRDMANRSLK